MENEEKGPEIVSLNHNPFMGLSIEELEARLEMEMALDCWVEICACNSPAACGCRDTLCVAHCPNQHACAAECPSLCVAHCPTFQPCGAHCPNVCGAYCPAFDPCAGHCPTLACGAECPTFDPCAALCPTYQPCVGLCEALCPCAGAGFCVTDCPTYVCGTIYQ